jgi:hypothetical protein
MRGIRARAMYRVVLMILRANTEPHPFRKMMLAFLRDDLAGAFGVLFRRLFPSKGEIVSRYRLPSFSLRATVYYFFNPLLLLVKRGQKNRIEGRPCDPARDLVE